MGLFSSKIVKKCKRATQQQQQLHTETNDIQYNTIQYNTIILYFSRIGLNSAVVDKETTVTWNFS